MLSALTWCRVSNQAGCEMSAVQHSEHLIGDNAAGMVAGMGVRQARPTVVAAGGLLVEYFSPRIAIAMTPN
jgi:hypothetical protein